MQSCTIKYVEANKKWIREQERGQNQNQGQSRNSMEKRTGKTAVQIGNSSASYNQQFKRKGQIPMEKVQVQCFICGKDSCLEDTDHKKMTFPQFDTLLKTKAGYEPRIVKIKHKIRKSFEILKQATNQNLEPYVIDLFLMVDKLHFWHFLKHTSSLNDVQAAIFGFMLPKKKIIKLISLLDEPADPNVTFPKFQKLLCQIHKFKKNWKRVVENGLYGELIRRFVKIISDCEAQFRKECPLECRECEQNLNAGLPTQNEEQIYSELVLMEGIPFSTARRSIDLSVLELTDQNFLNCYSAILKMKELAELQIRNSRLSERSYRMLFAALPNLQSLDLSSSNSDNFFKIIGEKLPKLKTLYLNQTSLDNEKLHTVTENLKHLRVLFADENKITNEGVETLFKNKKQLMYASLKGNQISDQLGLKIQLNLTFKGGYLEY